VEVADALIEAGVFRKCRASRQLQIHVSRDEDPALTTEFDRPPTMPIDDTATPRRFLWLNSFSGPISVITPRLISSSDFIISLTESINEAAHENISSQS